MSLDYDGEHGKIIKLEELCLKGNRLTAESLLSLGDVIARASSDLRDLDLSENLFSVSTRQDTNAWEYFLRSFSKCHVLRRVDLSRNPLGTKAFEVFTRVYSQEEPLDLEAFDLVGEDVTRLVDRNPVDADNLEPLRRMSIARDADRHAIESEDKAEKSNHRRKGSKQDESIFPHKRSSVQSSKTQSLPKLCDFSTAKGLRSVPFIMFCDTAMTDTGALYLSDVIASHSLPTRLLPLVPPAKAGPLTQQLDVYSATSKCQGIVYLPNDRITAVGIRVLELSEAARIGLLEDGNSYDNTTDDNVTPRVDTKPRRASEAPNSLYPLASGYRRATTSVGVHEPEGHRYGSTDLDRARSRIQGDTLRDTGPCSNDLWRASLKLLSLARIVLVKGVPNLTTSQQGTQQVESRNLPSQPGRSTRAATSKSSAMTPLAPGNVNQMIKVRLPPRRKEPLMPPNLQRPLEMSPNPRISRIISSLRDPNKPYRGPYVGQLHQAQWAYIIALAADVVGVVSPTQQKAILAMAMDRGSLGKEREILGKSESAQIWKALEGMGCLACEMR